MRTKTGHDQRGSTARDAGQSHRGGVALEVAFGTLGILCSSVALVLLHLAMARAGDFLASIVDLAEGQYSGPAAETVLLAEEPRTFPRTELNHAN